jgi:hypothetical protein
MKVFIMALLCLCLRGKEPVCAQSIDPALITGTYESHVYFRGAPITNKVRILYLTDSSFAFTMTGDASNGPPKKDSILLQFDNYFEYRGIARKISYRGKPAWIGVIEDYQARFGKDTGYFNPDLVITDINKLVDTTLWGSAFVKKYVTYNNYDLIQFSFPSPGESVEIRMFPYRLFGFADFFKETMGGEYRKLDNQHMIFPHSYYAINDLIAVIKMKAEVRQLPAEQTPANKKLAVFSPGTVVYLSSSPYQKYVLATLYDKNFHILQQGWIPMAAVKNLSDIADKFPPTTKYIYNIR